MRFKPYYEDIFQPASQEERDDRMIEYGRLHIDAWLKRNSDRIKQNPDGSYDSVGDKSIYVGDWPKGITFLPIKFNKTGDFTMTNTRLRTLENTPQFVDGNFDCSKNSLHTLEGGPKHVTGGFSCRTNYLVNLIGAPEQVGTKKDVFPGGLFDCARNILITLEGSPTVIPGDFNCANNSLENFKGGPEEVARHLVCSNNKYIESLEGFPKHVGGDVHWLLNQFGSEANRLFTEDDIRAVSQIDGRVFLDK